MEDIQLGDYLTAEEAGNRLGVSAASIRRRCRSGLIAAQKVDGQWLIDGTGLSKGKRKKAAGGEKPTESLDYERALAHLKSGDLKELWVPDILRFEDILEAPDAALAAARARVKGSGPFDPPTLVGIAKTPFFTRPAVLLSLVDRIAYHATVLSIAKEIDGRLSKSVFSARYANDAKYFVRRFQKDYQAFESHTRDAIADGYTHTIRTDVVAYFEGIPHRRLFQLIDELATSSAAAKPLKRMLGEWSLADSAGLPQGPAASRVLGNLYLHPVDEVMEAGPWKYSRYQDDFRIFGRSRAELMQGMRTLEEEVRKAGLTLSPQKTEYAEGDDALAALDDEELRIANYWFSIRNLGEAGKRLRKILKGALKGGQNLNVRRARFSLWRLSLLRDRGVSKVVMQRLEDLAPISSIVAAYLQPMLLRAGNANTLGEYLNDPGRNTSPFLTAWLLAAMMEVPSPVPDSWTDYARQVVLDKNHPAYLRSLAPSVLVLSGKKADVGLIQREIRIERDPDIARGLLVALARVGRLDRDIQRAAEGRVPEVAAVIAYLQGRDRLPSLVHHEARVTITRLRV